MKNTKQRITFLLNDKSTFAERLILNEEDQFTKDLWPRYTLL